TVSGHEVVLAATLFDGGGVYRSTDDGNTFTRLSGNGVSGLPDQGVSDLVPDPGNPSRFYAAVPSPAYQTGAGATGNEGVYRSDDGGQTWTSVSTGLTGLGNSGRMLLTVHNSAGNNVDYAAIIVGTGGAEGTLSGVFRSTDQ